MQIFASSSGLALAAALAAMPLASARGQEAPPAPETAQETPPEIGPDPAGPDMDENTIVIFGARLLGQVEAPQPPVLELGVEDIAAYGAGSVADLLQALGPQVTSGRGRGGGGGPVILVDGVRISSFRELRSYPPEAIEKVEVFSEEVAQSYGYSPDQRVVNFILKDNFSSREIELEYGQPFDGGYSTQQAEATYLRIDGPSRLNVNLGWENASLLTEGERGVIQAPGAPVNLGDFRSLVSDSAELEATVNWSTRLGQSSNSLSLNGTYERSNNLRLQGIAFNGIDALTVERQSETYAVGSTVNAGLGDWQLTSTVDASRAQTESEILNFDDSTDLADTRTSRASALLTARGSPFYLPAGDVTLTLDGGYDYNRIQSTDTRNPGFETDLDRGNLSAGFNLGVPLTSRRDDVLAAIGDISLNLGAGIDHLSDFGTLYDWSAGLTWGVTEALTLAVSHVNRDAAPSLAQLGDPEIATPNVPVFDIVNNETVLATVITGGNPNLPAQNQSDWKFGVQWELPFIENGSVSLDYFKNHSDNVSTGFPVLTPEIEAAFPGRVTRDAQGRLLVLDDRPVSFAAQDVERLQFGLNLSGEIGGEDEEEAPAQAGGARGGGQAGPGAFGGLGGGQGGRPAGMDPEQMAQMRAQFCDAEPATLIEQMNALLAARAAGQEPPVGPDGQPLAIPPQILERLTGADGRIDAERFNALRERICSTEGQQAGAAGGQGQQGGPGGPRPGAGAGGAGGGGGGGGGGPRGFGRFGGGGGQNQNGGRWFMNLQYTLELENRLLIAPGVPVLDLLEGDALSGGGQPRHSASLRVGGFYKGFGLTAFANYTGSSAIEGSGRPGSTDLYFGDFATFNLRAFADLGQQESLVRAVPLLDNTRIGIGIDNVFDTRQRVTDDLGIVPLRYQPFLVDPIGRSLEIEFRKLF